jgi:hypothetical protein
MSSEIKIQKELSRALSTLNALLLFLRDIQMPSASYRERKPRWGSRGNKQFLLLWGNYGNTCIFGHVSLLGFTSSIGSSPSKRCFASFSAY